MNTIFIFKIGRQGIRWVKPIYEARTGRRRKRNQATLRNFASLSMYSTITCLFALTLGCDDPSPSEESGEPTDSGTMSNSGPMTGPGETMTGNGDTGDNSGSVTLEHVGRGCFNSPFVVDETGAPWKVIAGSYQIRHIGGFDNQSTPASRDYFSFRLSGVQGTVNAAELHITHPSNSFDSADPTETITFYDVSTTVMDLEMPDVASDISILEGIFNDLGSGNEYGSFVANASVDGTVEIVSLNAAALTDIQNAINNGSDWSIGGSLTSPADTLTFGAFERVFRGSDASSGTPQPVTRLVLTGNLSQQGQR